MVFLIHTELRCTVNHTSDLHPVLFTRIRYCTHTFTIPDRMHSPWSYVTTTNNDPPSLCNTVPDRDPLASKPAVPMWLSPTDHLLTSTCADISYCRSQRSLLLPNVDATASSACPAHVPGHAVFLFSFFPFFLPHCDRLAYA